MFYELTGQMSGKFLYAPNVDSLADARQHFAACPNAGAVWDQKPSPQVLSSSISGAFKASSSAELADLSEKDSDAC